MSEKSFYEKNKDSILKSREKHKDKYLEYMRNYKRKKYQEENKQIIQERLEKRINKFLKEADKLGFKVYKNDIIV